MRGVRWGVFLAMCLAAWACGGRKSALVEPAPAPVKVGDATGKLAEAQSLWAERDDPAKALGAIAAWEAAEQLDPTDPSIPVTLARAYYFYAQLHLVWTEDEDEQKAAFDRGVTAGERAIKLLSPGFVEAIRNGKTWDEALPLVDRAALPALYWYATDLGEWASLDGITTLLSNKDLVFAIMERCLELQEGRLKAAPHRYFGVAYTRIPFPGGDLARSRHEFEQAIALDPSCAETKVFYARTYAVKAGDKELYTRLLNDVLALPDDALPDMVHETRNAKRKAQKMLEETTELF